MSASSSLGTSALAASKSATGNSTPHSRPGRSNAPPSEPDPLDQFDRDGFRSFPTLGHGNHYALALIQTRDVRPPKRGSMHEDILPAGVSSDETEPPGGVVRFHHSHLLGTRLQELLV